jgi:hypothetical protein
MFVVLIISQCVLIQNKKVISVKELFSHSVRGTAFFELATLNADLYELESFRKGVS